VWVFALTALFLAGLRPLAFRVGLVDKPDQDRKHHEGAVPLVGGIGMGLAFFVGCYYLQLYGGGFWGLWAGGFLLLFVGAIDDYSDLGAGIRFVAQIFAAGMMVFFGDVVLRDLGAIGWSEWAIGLGSLAIPFTIFSMVGVINALNMMDGVDGLAGSVSLTTVAGVAVLALYHGGSEGLAVGVTLLLAMAILAFLLFNWRHTGNRKALLFMGDAGSMFLGFIVCWLFIRFSQGEDRLFSPVVALWLFALPLIDTVTMMLRRVMKGNSPFAADREHFHHIFLAAGFSQRATVCILLGISVFCASFGVLGEILEIPENIMFLMFILLFCAHFWMTRHAWKAMRFMRRRMA
jgi:UDP-GlcNAc:undecaprenyl-phosphate GlcNAc-1-phosphate transferase